MSNFTYTDSGIYVEDNRSSHIELPGGYICIHYDELDEYYIVGEKIHGWDIYERKEGLNRI